MGEAAVDETVESDSAPAQAGGRRSYAVSKRLIIAGLITSTALSALDATVVATALPSIVGALGGLPLYSLVIASYLLLGTTTVPLYGKLSDMYGRKPTFIVGAGIFVVGSLLCGLAWDMPSLIAFRALQGIGAGAVLPVSLTIIGDLFEIEERARLSGVFSSVWGVSSIIGPLIGGAIVQFWDWRWVFFINVPVGIASIALIFLNLREPAIHTRQRLDVLGALTLTVGVGLLLIGLQSGSREGWLAPATLQILGGAMVFLAIFGLVERRTASPILSLDLLARPVIAISCMVGIMSGAVLIGLAAYVPVLVQGSWGGTPIEAGLIVAPLSIGWPIASSQSGKLLRNYSYKTLTLAGMGGIVLGMLLFLPVFAQPFSESVPLRTLVVVVSTFVAGLGFGLSFSSILITVQNSVPWRERGITTASIQFFRSMGNTVGAALLGAILTLSLTPLLATPQMRSLLSGLPATATHPGADPALGPVNALFDLEVRDTLSAPIRSALSGALSNSLGWLFLAVALLALTGLLLATRLPRVVVDAED